MSNMSHDIRTPMNAIVGTTVIATARRIQEKLGNHVPILLISAYDWGEIEHETSEPGESCWSRTTSSPGRSQPTCWAPRA